MKKQALLSFTMHTSRQIQFIGYLLILFWIRQGIPANSQIYPFKTYSVNDGLLQSRVNTLMQDSQGYLWIGTDSGVCKFDGSRFYYYDANGPLINGHITDILEDSSTHIWIATQQGVHHYNRSQWYYFNRENGLIDNHILTLYEDRQGKIWIGTEKGVQVWNGETWNHFLPKEDKLQQEIYAIYEDHLGTFWFGAFDGVYQFNTVKSAFQKIERFKDLCTNIIYEDSKGNLWIGNSDGLFRYKDREWTHYYYKVSPIGNYVQTIVEEQNGSLWIGYSKGLAHFDGNQRTIYTTKNGLPDNNVYDLCKDHENNLWIGTWRGLVKLQHVAFSYFTTQHGLTNNAVSSILETEDGSIWFGTFGDGINYFEGETWSSFLTDKRINSKIVLSILQHRQEIWVGTQGGIYVYDGSDWRQERIHKNNYSRCIYTGMQTDSGEIWYGTRGGVCHYDGQQWSVYTTQDGLNHSSVYSLLKDSQGFLWAGTHNGLSRLDDESWSTYLTQDGLPGNTINTLYEDENGKIWIGTQNNGISCFDGKEFTNFSIQNGLPDKTIYFIFQHKDHMYFGTNQGLCRYDGNRFNTYAAEDGLPSNEMNRGAWCRDSHGNFWLGTMNGAVYFEPDRLPDQQFLPIIHLTNATSIHSNRHLSDGCHLAYHENSIRFDFVGIYFSSAHRLLYEYRLKGLNENWNTTRDRFVLFHHLEPGEYQFAVRAKTQNGSVSHPPTAFHLVIESPFWAQWWFYVCIVLIFAGSVYLVTHEIDKRKTYSIIRANEQKYRLLTENAADIIWSMNSDFQYTYVSPAVKRIRGFTVDEAMHHSPEQDMTEESCALFRKTIQEKIDLCNNAKDQQTPFHLELHYYCKDGSVIPADTIVTVICDPMNHCHTVQGITRDISERKRTEQMLEEQRQQLIMADKMAALGVLVSGVAHEINNPTSFIMVNTPIIKKAWKDAEPIMEQYYRENGEFTISRMPYTFLRDTMPKLFQGIIDGTTRIKRIVDDLRTFTRYEQSDNFEEIDVNQVVKSAIGLLNHLIKNSTKKFHAEYAHQLPKIKGNFQRLEQVVINLVQNACQALTSKDQAIMIKTQHDPNTESVFIMVQDEGMGIEESDMPKIMDPFFTTKRESGGTGLGLSVSAGIIKEHRGSLRFESVAGEGTKAIIQLPCN